MDKEKATTHNIGIKVMLDSYSGDAVTQQSKEDDIMENWEDAVFRHLVTGSTVVGLARRGVGKMGG